MSRPTHLRKRISKLLLAASIVSFAAGIAGWLALPLVPLPPALFVAPPEQQELLDRNGVPLRAVRAGDGPFLRAVSLGEIPQALIHATLAAEDKRFWRHPGVDWRASLRAARDLVQYRRVVSGGSTITQQLIKLAQPRPRTFRAKVIEAVQALRLEQVWDKQRILTEYLDRVDYGNLNTGCAAAADFYFGKPLAELSAAECALLAGLPQSPTRLNPFAHPERARKRQQWILEKMRADGFLTGLEYERAGAETLRFKFLRRPFEAPHFVDLLLSSLAAQPLRASHSSARQNGAQAAALRTTLDLELNRFAEEAVRRQLARLGPQHVGDAAAVIIDNRSGGVLALVGSGDYFAPGHGQVNGAWAARSAGSTFKPFTYLIALEQGATPASVVADVPAEFATPTGLFAPVNYDRHCHGPVRYRLALANSLNIAAVKVLASIGGPASLQEKLQACGLTTLTDVPEHYGLGLAIGNADARLLELANAYACLARLGEYRPFTLLETCRARDMRPNPGATPAVGLRPSSGAAGLENRLTPDPSLAPAGRDLPLPPSGVAGLERADALKRADVSRSSEPAAPGDGRTPYGMAGGRTPRSGSGFVFDPAACFLLADILSDNDARALEFGLESNLRFDFPVACKTGTSSDFRDNWAFGYTPEFTVGVWAGNFDGSPMHDISGVTGAAPILHELMEHLHGCYGTSWYTTPANIVSLPIHPVTGKLLGVRPWPSAKTPGGTAIEWTEAIEKSQVSRCPAPAAPEDGRTPHSVASGRTPPEAVLEKFIAGRLPPDESPEDYDAQGRIRLGAEYADWLGTSDNWLAGQAVASQGATAFRIVFPLPGTLIYLDPDLPDGGRRLRLRVEGATDPQWRSQTLKCRQEAGQTVALLTPGEHRLQALDPRTGLERETWVQVMRR